REPIFPPAPYAALFRSPFRIENAIKFGHELRNITYSNVIGQTFIALVQGGALALGFWIFGFDDPLFWGVICAILAFVPLLGPPRSEEHTSELQSRETIV